MLLHVLQVYSKVIMKFIYVRKLFNEATDFFVILHVCVKSKECLYKIQMKIETASNKSFS